MRFDILAFSVLKWPLLVICKCIKSSSSMCLISFNVSYPLSMNTDTYGSYCGPKDWSQSFADV